MVSMSRPEASAHRAIQSARLGEQLLAYVFAGTALALASPSAAMAQRPPKQVDIPMTPDWPKKGDRIVKADQIRITGQTYFCVHTWFSPAMQKAVEGYPGYYQGFSSWVIDSSRKYFKNKKFPGNISYSQIWNRFYGIPSDTDGTNNYCLNDGINVMLTSHVDLNGKGQPYKLTLVARQGRKYWAGYIERLTPDNWPAPNRPGDRLGSSIGLDIMSLTDIILTKSHKVR